MCPQFVAGICLKVRAGAEGAVNNPRINAPARAKGPIFFKRIMVTRYQGSSRGLRSGVENSNSLWKLAGWKGRINDHRDNLWPNRLPSL
jgi:hypothetical protein